MNIKDFINSLFAKKGVVSVREKPNWKLERYESVVSERNLLAAFVFLAIILILICVLALLNVVDQKRIDPFVIQIDQSTGEASVVNPLSVQTLSGYDSLSKYFIKKYITARETYNPVDFDTTARRYIKLSSTDTIYSQYFKYIKDPSNDPRIIYGANNITYMKLRSCSKMSDNKYYFRYSIHETSGEGRVNNKISIVEFTYEDSSNLSEDDQDLNPVGFKVTAYRTDDDNS